MEMEGRLRIEIGSRDGLINGVRIGSSRMVQAAKVLAGRDSASALALLPLLFSVCGTSQGLAGLGACEMALGLTADSRHHAARHLLLLAETTAEHLLILLRDWAPPLGEVPSLAALRGPRDRLRAMAGRLYPDGDWLHPGGGRLCPNQAVLLADLGEIRAAIRSLVFGGGWAGALSPEGFEPWCRSATTVPARLLRLVMQSGLSGFGCGSVQPLPVLDDDRLAARLGSDDGRFLAHPTWAGQCHETGPYARQADHSLVAGQVGGLLARLTAFLVELAGCCEDMEALIPELAERPAARTVPDGSGVGVAQVEAPRGRLAHWVELRDGKIRDWKILAPTEWNFHPEGALASGLLGGACGEGCVQAVKLAIIALAPCVPWELVLTADGSPLPR